MTGEQALANIVEQLYVDNTTKIADDATIELTTIFDDLTKHATDSTLMRSAIDIDGGFALGGTTLSVETNVINMPLRYQSQLKKMIWAEQDYDVNIYMIIDSPFVSTSNLKIALASSVAAYQDDEATVQAKIQAWFHEELQLVAENARKQLDAPQES